jgi:hypothetical protein
VSAHPLRRLGVKRGLLLSNPAAPVECHASTKLPLDSVCRVWREGMTSPTFRRLAYGNLAGDMNGLVASSTNMTSWSRSLVPLLKTSIGMSAPCPFMVWPASAWLTPCGVFWATRPVRT